MVKKNLYVAICFLGRRCPGLCRLIPDARLDANGDGVFDLTSAAEKPDGIRRWRTVLIGAAGEGGSEVFALDVTNPLKPALLWDISGAREKGGVFDPTDPATWAAKLVNPKTGLAVKSTDAQPIVKTALYDYRHLGLTYGSAVGMLRRGNAYRYVVYIATSAADYTAATPLGFRGLEVFAIDVITGEKLWHWQNRYQVARDAAGLEVIADTVIPGRPALVDMDQNGTVDRVYVGDMEGKLWELDAETGKNVNFLRDSGGGSFFSLPFFGTPPMTGGLADDATKADRQLAGFAEAILAWNGRAEKDSTGALPYRYWKEQLDKSDRDASNRLGLLPKPALSDEAVIRMLKGGVKAMIAELGRTEHSVFRASPAFQHRSNRVRPTASAHAFIPGGKEGGTHGGHLFETPAASVTLLEVADKRPILGGEGEDRLERELKGVVEAQTQVGVNFEAAVGEAPAEVVALTDRVGGRDTQWRLWQELGVDLVDPRFQVAQDRQRASPSFFASGVRIKGSAFVDAEGELILDPRDPFCMGIRA